MTRNDPTAAFNAQIATAQAHVDAGHMIEAITVLERAVKLQPQAGGAWRSLGTAKAAVGDTEGASAAHARAAQLSFAQRPVSDAAAAIAANRLASAEQIIRTRLQQVPNDVAAIMLLATLAARAGNAIDAVRFLRHALEIAPGYEPARSDLARTHYDNRDLPEALAEFDRLLATNPSHPGYRNMRAGTLDLLGEHDAAIAAYRAMLDDDPDQPSVWATLGNVLKTTGAIPGAIAAFRRGIERAPGTGDAWWGLANLKSFRFDAADVAVMQAQLDRTDLPVGDRIGIEFALGKALEDEAQYAASFAHYEAGNSAQLAQAPHDPDYLPALTRRYETLFTPEFFAVRAGMGDPSPDPIFILGMPRSGSTLVEQMLASHPAIEGVSELPEMPRLTRMLGGLGVDPARAAFPDSLAALTGPQLAGLGGEYLRRASRWRRTDRPFFVDKLPMNFVSIGLIRMILPNARIIDVRRHPLGCGFSVFKQYFPSGLSFSTSSAAIGRFYADYIRMMDLWDERLPGVVHRTVYERLVADPEREIRSLLDHIGVPFDPGCLGFHDSARAVRTPSAEQVRRPLYTEAVEHWRHYDAWLGPMKDALGDVLEHYPERIEAGG